MSYQLETTALIFKEIKIAFRIRCIMLILEKLIKVKIVYVYMFLDELEDFVQMDIFSDIL